MNFILCELYLNKNNGYCLFIYNVWQLVYWLIFRRYLMRFCQKYTFCCFLFYFESFSSSLYTLYFPQTLIVNWPHWSNNNFSTPTEFNFSVSSRKKERKKGKSTTRLLHKIKQSCCFWENWFRFCYSEGLKFCDNSVFS